MALDFPAFEPLSLSSLVVVEEDLEPYVLEWPTVPDADGVSEAMVLAIMKREKLDFCWLFPPVLFLKVF